MLGHSCESLEVSARLADSVGARRSSGPRASRSHLQPDGRFGLSPPPQVSFMVCHMIRCSNSIVRGAQAHPQGDVDPPPLVERYRRSRAPVSRRHVAGAVCLQRWPTRKRRTFVRVSLRCILLRPVTRVIMVLEVAGRCRNANVCDQPGLGHRV